MPSMSWEKVKLQLHDKACKMVGKKIILLDGLGRGLQTVGLQLHVSSLASLLRLRIMDQT